MPYAEKAPQENEAHSAECRFEDAFEQGGGHKESSLISTAAGGDVLKRLASSKVKISWLKIRNQRIAIKGLEIRRSCEWGGNAPGGFRVAEC
ncbi:hypothetical protein [Bilophila wadsworthia]|jgi:hypothetical protein|uniref:hypothetical protein n=1 Tax=Bilophila wadsworthia TaxID=35833 RepID=UPI00242EF1EC|nr:hypothetical protein [Bilophila wadsworthia]